MNIKTSLYQQERLAKYVLGTYEDYKSLNEKRHATLLKIYKAFATYEEKKKADWQTNFKLNKAHEIVERVLPRVIARNPKWIVTPRIYDFWADKSLPEDSEERKAEIKRRNELQNDYSNAIQDYLSYVFEEYDFEKYLRLFAKKMIVYGNSYAKIGYKYEMYRQKIGDSVEESIKGEHPYIDVKSWTEILTDPRYMDIDEMPALIEIESKIRWNDLKRDKQYFNLKKVQDVLNTAKGENSNKEQLLAINGVNWVEKTKPDANQLTLLKYYGWYQENEHKPETEKMIEATIVKEFGIVIGYKEISRIPFVQIKAFEDTDTGFSVGFVEPMMSLQDELNFKKNSASEYINQALNRSWIWSEQSGVDPRDLVSKPGNIIVTNNGVQEAMANLQELPHRTIPPDYFQEQIDFERQIQSMTFTIDTANPKGEQALTNTATGMRIKFFESNSVIDEVRKHFEQGLKELAYQLLQETFENMDENIVFKKMGSDEYWEMNKEALRDAVNRYTITVEANSSSFDSLETKRNDALAFWNILMQAAQAGAQVDLEKGLSAVIETFEKRDPNEFLKAPDMAQLAAQTPQIQGGGQIPPQSQQPSPAELTDQVAGGEIGSMAEAQTNPMQ